MTSVLGILAMLLAPLPFAPSAQAAFPGDAGLIAFVSNETGNYDIFVMNPNGSGKTRLTDDPGDDVLPQMSPDGTTVAYTCACGGLFDLYLVSVDGTGRRNLTPGPGGGFFAAFFPDGERIAFQSGRSGNQEIYAVNLDATGLTNLTNDPAMDDVSPQVSPDGTRLAFTKQIRDPDFFGRDAAIYVMRLNGTGLTRLTPEGMRAGDPDWSPDGRFIVFNDERCAGQGCGESDIFVMSRKGTGLTQLTTTPTNDARPSWSPEGDLILFQSGPCLGTPENCQGLGNSDLYLMDPDGDGLRNLTNTAFGEGAADWGPKPPD